MLILPYISVPSAIRLSRIIILAGLLAALAGCQIIQRNIAGSTDSPDGTGGHPNDSSAAPEAPLDSAPQPHPELLYDTISAYIALQKNQPEAALEHLSRAAYESGEYGLVTDSVRLALASGEFEQAIDLAQLLDVLDPDNHEITLLVARAHFGLGENQSALDLLADLTKRCNQEHNHVFQDIASLLTSMGDTAVLDSFHNLVATRADNTGLQMTSAFAALIQNQPQRHIQQLHKVLTLEPDWEIPAVLLLTQLGNGIDNATSAEENRNTASRYAIQHLQDYPGQIRFRLQFAHHLIQNNDLNLALEQLDIILGLDEDTLDALYTTGVIYLERGDLVNARESFVRYLQLNPSSSQARIYLSDIEYRQDNYIAASEYLHGVVSPQYYLDAQTRLAVILAKQHEVDAGIKYLQQIQAVSDEDRIRLILEQDSLLRQYDHYDRSKQILDQGLQRFPDHPDLLYNRGLLTAQMGLIDLHEQDMRKLIEIEPDNAHAYNAFGYTLADKTDRLEEAMVLIKKANTLLPNNAFILDSMGWIHFRLGDNNKAINYLLLALDARQDAEIAAHLGEVLWVSGNRDEARKVWNQGSEWEPENGVLKQTIERFSP